MQPKKKITKNPKGEQPSLYNNNMTVWNKKYQSPTKKRKPVEE